MLNKEDVIVTWLERIQNSELSISQFFSKNNVPFSRSQYFIYKKKFTENGIDGLADKRKNGNNLKMNLKEEAFLQGYIAGGGSILPCELQKILFQEFNCEVSQSTIKRKIDELSPNQPLAKIGRPISKLAKEIYNLLGGFELLVAVAYYLEWPQRTTETIIKAINSLEDINQNSHKLDLEGRNSLGQFTDSYNQRLDVRKNRFASVSEKRKHKNWNSLKIIEAHENTISKKNLAILSLPIVTGNGRVRTVNLAQGQSLGHFCGFNYTQGTISKFLSELKYLSTSSFLLADLPEFWRKCWGNEFNEHSGPLLCYYIDGNTKALWSSERVKQNKVTMLGRVMGCLEQVFVHDGLGNPIYFETYSGHAPVGEYILSLFEKIEATISEIPSSNTHVLKALVMDSASNSVKTIRAFAAQDKYYFITPLDNNQFKPRKERSRSYPIRYKYGKATLRNTEIEMEDSTETGHLISVRAVKIDWDNGKCTVLITNIPKEKVDAHEIVFSYFRRWPVEELKFREQKASVSLNRVAGYGKKEVENERVKEALQKLDIKKNKLENKLAEPLENINYHSEKIARLIPKERRLRAKTIIEDGKRTVPSEISSEFEKCNQKICQHELAIKAIEEANKKDLTSYRKTFKEWLRLQGKDTVFEADVELDQILTYYRASLVHICAYFIKHFLGNKPISLVMLFHRIVQLEARVINTSNERKVILKYNKQDSVMMENLAGAIKKLNNLAILGNNKKIYHFEIK